MPGGDAVGGGGGGGGAPHDLLVDESDRRRKNVDSGRVAIIFASDSFRSFKEKWSGTSKERRHWAAEVLALDRALNCKLIFIEVSGLAPSHTPSPCTRLSPPSPPQCPRQLHALCTQEPLRRWGCVI